MTQKQITHLQDMIDDFFSETQTEAIIDSEGYPHSPYVSQLGTSLKEFVHFIDEVNEHLGNPVELSPLLLNEPSFRQCRYNLSHNILEPEVMLHLVQSSDVVDSLNNKLVCSVWRHDSRRLIQLLQQQFYSMNDDKYYMKTLSCNEVVAKFNKLTKDTDYILKEEI